jgi:hypothetical protein
LVFFSQVVWFFILKIHVISTVCTMKMFFLLGLIWGWGFSKMWIASYIHTYISSLITNTKTGAASKNFSTLVQNISPNQCWAILYFYGGPLVLVLKTKRMWFQVQLLKKEIPISQCSGSKN